MSVRSELATGDDVGTLLDGEKAGGEAVCTAVQWLARFLHRTSLGGRRALLTNRDRCRGGAPLWRDRSAVLRRWTRCPPCARLWRERGAPTSDAPQSRQDQVDHGGTPPSPHTAGGSPSPRRQTSSFADGSHCPDARSWRLAVGFVCRSSARLQQRCCTVAPVISSDRRLTSCPSLAATRGAEDAREQGMPRPRAGNRPQTLVLRRSAACFT